MEKAVILKQYVTKIEGIYDGINKGRLKMSVGLYKYDGNIYDDAKEIISDSNFPHLKSA